jgi:phosphoribosylglycinamide formyltransferase-1
MNKLIILASGSGSNALKIIEYFENQESTAVSAVLTDNRHAGVLDKCKALNIPTLYFSAALFRSSAFIDLLNSFGPDLIILAGFLKKIPSEVIAEYPDKIINFHPSLLPKYGGKGMYGAHVHHAVKENNEPESGISIHYVNEHYDQGQIIAQFKVALDSQDNAEQIAKKVQQLEHLHFAPTIATLLKNNE